MLQNSILVMGASGLVGRHVLAMLHKSGHSAFDASRSTQGEQRRTLDLNKPETYAGALRGIATVMLISPLGDEQAHYRTAQFIALLSAHGVERVVVLSALGAENRPDLSNRKVEILIEQSGLHWTHIRPNFLCRCCAARR
jgi:Predicted nucleoside-diphosphate-sugar epimerases